MYSARSRAMFMVRGKMLIEESRYAGYPVYEWRLKPRYNQPTLNRQLTGLSLGVAREAFAACPLHKTDCRICAVAANHML